MTPEEVYVSPNGKVLVTNFKPYYSDDEKEMLTQLKAIPYEVEYHLEIGRWYELGLKSPAPNADEFVYVIHDDYKHIGHYPKHFMSKVEWRERQLDKIL